MENHGNFEEKIPAERSTQSRRMPKRRLYCDVPDAIVSAEIQDPEHSTSHRFEVKKYMKSPHQDHHPPRYNPRKTLHR